MSEKLNNNSGENSNFPFDFDDLAKHIPLKPTELFSALHFLERMGLIALSDDTERSSTLYIPLNTNELEFFYKQQSAEDITLFQ